MKNLRMALLLMAVVAGGAVELCRAQNAGTGAIAGTVTDPAGAVVPNARITVTNQATGEVRSAVSSSTGHYVVPLLLPGTYRVGAAKEGFKTADVQRVVVNVTETEAVNIRFQIGAANETVEVQAGAEELQTETSALGHVTGQQMVESLPLVTRNYTEIIGLSPGISTEVTNAGEIGRGGGGSAETPLLAGGGSSKDNNFQMNGVEINDLQGSGHFSGGVAIPNPDTIQEFKVQTSQYDASYGRDAGANVNVVTKGGTNDFHGTLFEFFRNEALNANDFFRNRNDQPTPVLRQNQFGFTFGGPIKKNKLFFFTSYQGTRQKNGVDQNCSSNFSMPPLTNDRSRAALGALFAGRPTFIQQITGLPVGPTVLPDGSNISDQALALLNRKLPDGSYLIPTPQRIDATQPFDTQGFSAFSIPCTFNEEQFMTNGDWVQSDKSKLSLRFFFANSHQTESLPLPNLGGPTAPGFPTLSPNHFRNFSLSHTYLFTPSLLNQIQIGYHRQFVLIDQAEAFSYSDVGVTTPAFDNNIPEIFINGALTLGGNGQGVQLAQNTYVFQDDMSWTRGRHALRFGGGVTRAQDNFTHFHYLAGMLFLSFPDFLLGQDGITNGTGISNVFGSVDIPALYDRAWRVWDADAYVQDDWKLTPRLTLNLGFRYDRLGDLGDELGRNSAFDVGRANPNPPPSGSFDGFIVSNNYKGPMPAGVTQVDNNLGLRGLGQNTWNPRVGFAWQLPGTNSAVLRGGYGIYHERITGQPLLQLILNQPFAILRQVLGPVNAGASFAVPFDLNVPPLPSFTPYSPTTQLNTNTFAQDFRPPNYQRYSLSLQTAIARDMVLEVGYGGARGTHLLRSRLANQAEFASPTNPIRGETTNTLDNIPLRAPLLGWTTNNLVQFESEGASWYNSLQTSVNKRFSNGLQFLASYTWARDLATDVDTFSGANGGTAVGDQTNPRARYGPEEFQREHRFVVSYVYDLPFFKGRSGGAAFFLGGWRVAGVTTIQSGHRLSVLNTNVNNVLGINGFGQDFAQLAPGCTLAQVNTPGSVTDKLNNYINASCFATAPPVVGSDGLATGFGNTRPGIIHGPDQRNTDLSLIKNFVVPWPNERSNLEFRTEFFNAFNTPQFSDPDAELDSPTFGQVLSTSVAPRIMQFALKFNF